jgi:hypothetical protein
MDNTLNRVGVAPTGVTAVHPQTGMAFAGGPTTTCPVARNQSPTNRTSGEMDLAGEAQDPASNRLRSVDRSRQVHRTMKTTPPPLHLQPCLP